MGLSGLEWTRSNHEKVLELKCSTKRTQNRIKTKIAHSVTHKPEIVKRSSIYLVKVKTQLIYLTNHIKYPKHNINYLIKIS